MIYNSNQLNNTWKLKKKFVEENEKRLLILIHLKNIEATLVVANKIALVVDFCLFSVCLTIKRFKCCVGGHYDGVPKM
jgi:hypothetical protein